MTTEAQAGYPSTKVDVAIFHQRLYRPDPLDNYNPNEPFVAASLAKPYMVAAVFSLANQATIDLDEPVHITWEQFQDGNYGTGRLRQTPRAKLMRLIHRANPSFNHQLIPPQSLVSLLYRSIADSDNLALQVVADYIGRSRIQQVVDSWGMRSTSIYDPETGRQNITTARDIGHFLINLGRGELIPPDSKRLMRSWVKREVVSGMALLPAQVVSHAGRNTVNKESYFHRAGFFQARSSKIYAFAVLTRGPEFRREGISYEQEMKLKETLEAIVQNSP